MPATNDVFTAAPVVDCTATSASVDGAAVAASIDGAAVAASIDSAAPVDGDALVDAAVAAMLVPLPLLLAHTS